MRSDQRTIQNSILSVFVMTALSLSLWTNFQGISHAESNFDQKQPLRSAERPANAGDIDTSFGTFGRSVINVSPNGGLTPPHEWANAVAVQTDNKIVAAGYSGAGYDTGNPPPEQFAIIRLNVDGTPDTGFGSGGIVTTQLSPVALASRAQAVALQPDGKIIAAGFAATGFGSETGFALARYNTNGTLDTTFGIGGKVVTTIGTFGTAAANAIVLQPNGMIVVSGVAQPNLGDSDFALARYKIDGSLDSTFGSGGQVTTDFGSLQDQSYAVALQIDGKIVAVGQVMAQSGDIDYAVIRYEANGAPDTGFGTNGKVTTNVDGVGDSARAVAIQRDGKIVVSGGQPNFTVVRYTSNGSLDTGFGGNNTGKVVVIFPGGAFCYAMALQPNGKIIIGGGWAGAFTMARFNSDGTGDGSFGSIGISTAGFPPDGTTINAMALQRNGEIVVAGENIDGVSLRGSFVVARFFNDIPSGIFTHLSSDFDGDGRTDLSVFRPSDGNWYVLQSNTNTLGVVHWGLSTDTPVPADFDGDGKSDVSVMRVVGSSLKWYIFQSSTLTMRAANFGAVGDKPVVGDYDGDGKADLAIFRPSTGDWWILRSLDDQINAVHWGSFGDIPTPADYDGDGKTDVSVWRPGTSNGPSFWYTLQSSNQTVFSTQFGLGLDRPVPADYDGDGKANYAVYRPSNGTWYTSLDPATNYGAQQWGISSDICVPGDYDGDGKTDVAVYRNGVWYIRTSASGFQYAGFGLTTDTPIPFAVTPQP